MKEKKFKNTEIGPIPVDWEVKAMRHYVENFTGLTYRPEDVSDYGTLVLRSSNIKDGALAYDDNVFVSCKIPERAITKMNDILVCVRNGSAKLVGKSAKINTDKPMAFGAFMTVLRAQEGVNSDYLHYYWQSASLQKQVNDNKGNIINQITGADIQRYKIILPPLAEQEAIGEALREVDELIEGLKKLVAKKRAIKQGAMSQLLSGKSRLPGFGNNKYKNTELGQIPVDWEIKSIAEVAPLQRGFDLPKSCLTAGDYPVVYSNGIGYYHNQFQCKAPGLVTGRSGTIGKFTLISEGYYWPHNTTLWVTNFNNNDPLYLYYRYSSLSFEDSATGTGVPTLNRNYLKDKKIAVPPLAEQEAIAKVLSDMDAEIEALSRKVAKYEQVKQGMMQQLLTGKIRLV